MITAQVCHSIIERRRGGMPSPAMQPLIDLVERTESFNKSAVPYRYPITQVLFEFLSLNKLTNGELPVQVFLGRMKFRA